ncbi:MAG: hypothetical protein ACREQ9_11920 [Candidatus Binatia bacterium]
MARRVASGLLVGFLLLAGAAEAIPQAPRLPTGSSLASAAEAAAVVALPADGRRAATLVGGHRNSRQLARFSSAEAPRPVRQPSAAAPAPPQPASFHRKSPLPRSNGDDSDSH